MVAATTVVNLVIWLYVMEFLFSVDVTNDTTSALALLQPAQVLFQVLAVVLVFLVEASAVDFLLVVPLLADLVLPLATNAVDQTTLLVIARLRP